jgi:hypothetical protein
MANLKSTKGHTVYENSSYHSIDLPGYTNMYMQSLFLIIQINVAHCIHCFPLAFFRGWGPVRVVLGIQTQGLIHSTIQLFTQLYFFLHKVSWRLFHINI